MKKGASTEVSGVLVWPMFIDHTRGNVGIIFVQWAPTSDIHFHVSNVCRLHLIHRNKLMAASRFSWPIPRRNLFVLDCCVRTFRVPARKFFRSTADDGDSSALEFSVHNVLEEFCAIRLKFSQVALFYTFRYKCFIHPCNGSLKLLVWANKPLRTRFRK